MPKFTVHNIFEIPLESNSSIHHIIDEKWRKSNALKKGKWNDAGCYIFSVQKGRNAKGYTPIYVGKATKSFGQECFTYHKINLLNQYLLHHTTKKLFIFLIKHPKKQGTINIKAINEMERFLIKSAASVNKDLLNTQNTSPYIWSIRGVIRGGAGKPSESALALRDQLGLDGK